MMKKCVLVVAILCLTLGAVASETKKAEEKKLEKGFVSMFNGKDLSGWEGIPGAWWVEDGLLTAESTPEKPCKKSHYLYWTTAKPGDFVLRFKFKLIGGNSGVQIRSEERPDFDTWGYQADFESGEQWTGCLFQHDRGGVVMRGFKAIINEDGTREEKQFIEPDKLQKKIKQEDWNEYEVTAIGSKVTLKINGQLMCEVDDRDEKMACKKGLIAVQMHQGDPMKVQFKDMRIKILDKQE